MSGYLSGRTSLTTVQTGNLADGAVTSAKIGTGEVATADIADNAVSLAKMASGTASQNIQYDGSGDPVDVALSGGGWEFVSTTTVSTSSSVTFESLAASYDYQVAWHNVESSGNDQFLVTFGTGATPTYQTSGYAYSGDGVQNTTHTQVHSTSDSNIPLHGTGTGTGAGNQAFGECTLYDPAHNDYTSVSWLIGRSVSSGGRQFTAGVGYRATAEVVTALKIAPSTGTWSNGDFTLFRRANA
jgi:hypothetical protein|tara:strand:+ start:593 stop:1318 length:726 start_codon:yes stop_codon:yes gene_type:complete